MVLRRFDIWISQGVNLTNMKRMMTLSVAVVLAGVLFGCSTTGKHATTAPPSLQAILQNMETDLPELRSQGVTAGTSSPAEALGGEEYATAGYRVVENPNSNHPSTDETKLWHVSVTIHHYASADAAQKDLQKSFDQRPAMQPPRENYRGASLYRYHYGAGHELCQMGPYLVEIEAYRTGGEQLTMKVLDVILAGLHGHKAR